MSERTEQLDQALEALRDRELDPASAGGAVALEFLLASAAPAAPVAAAPSAQPSSAVAASGGEGTPIDALAGWAGVDPLRLGDFFDFSEGNAALTVPSGRLPRSKADRQRLLTLLVLAADRQGLGAERTPAAPVIAVLHHYAAFDQNMSGNLKKIGSEISRSGRSKDYVYKITQPGLDHAKALIRQLVTNEEALEA